MSRCENEPVASPVDVEMTGLNSAPTSAQQARAEASARAELVASLRSVVDGEVSDSTLRRAEYTTDASNYRVVPQVVVIPLNVDDALAAVEATRAAGVPLTARGGGTSCAGNAVGPGVVIDFSRHVNEIHEIDPEARTARVDPGVIMSSLQKAAAPHGLRFGPDPSTQNRATLGGMIGNNACGPHAVAYGRTADNVFELDVVDGAGRRFVAGPTGSAWRGSLASASSSRRTSRRCAPSSAVSAARCLGTRSSTFCRRTAPTSGRRSSGRREPS